MRKLVLIISIIILLFASSKIKSIDISNELYPTSFAFDYDDSTSEYTLFFQIINPSFLSKNENVRPNSKNSTFSIKQKGTSFYDCYNKLNSITKKRISLRHIQSMILTDSILKNEIITHDLLKLLIKNPILPTNIYIYGTSEKVEDLFNNQNILDESSFFTILNNPQDSNIASLIYPNTLLSICKAILDNKKMYYIPSIFLDENIENSDKEGEVSSNKVLNLDGCYFTQLNTYKFIYLPFEDINGFKYLYTKRISSLEIDDIDNKYFIEIHDINSKIKVYDDKNIMHLNLKGIDLICPYNENLNDIDNAIKNHIEKQLIDLYNISIKNNIDMFNINDLRYRHKKSPNITDFSINIETSYQSIQHYSSTNT